MATPAPAPTKSSILQYAKKAATCIVTCLSLLLDAGLVSDVQIRLYIGLAISVLGSYGVYALRNASITETGSVEVDGGQPSSEPSSQVTAQTLLDHEDRLKAVEGQQSTRDEIVTAVQQAVEGTPAPVVNVTVSSPGVGGQAQDALRQAVDTVNRYQDDSGKAGAAQQADPGSEAAGGPPAAETVFYPQSDETLTDLAPVGDTPTETIRSRPSPHKVLTRSKVAIVTEREVDGHRLGRHIEHDPRSRRYDVAEAAPAAISSVLWTRRVPVFDQGATGSCTGNAEAGMVATDSKARQGRSHVTVPAGVLGGLSGDVPVDEKLAVSLYVLNTRLDNIPGTYPAQDTGSTGLAIGKSLVRVGQASGYRHAFSVAGLMRGLQLGPVAIGIPWFAGFDRPDKTGLVRLSGSIRGGHELEVVGLDLDKSEVVIANSWGESWTSFVPQGCAGRGGYLRMSITDLSRALASQGDALSPVFV